MKHLSTALCIAILFATGSVAGCSKEKDAEAAPKQASTRTFVIPGGTSFIAVLQSPISTETNHTGDAFTARTTDPILVDGKTAIPAGATIRGVLGDVVASGRVAGRARMTLNYESIVDAKGQSHSLPARPLSLQAASEARGDVEKIVAGTALGAITGGVVAGGKGAAIGAGVGAGAGTIVVLATKGEDLLLGAGQKLSIHLTGSMSVKVTTDR